jgi:hypothetical protein
MELNPSAARSLEEGMEETLTVHRLCVPVKLRQTLASTHVIESAFSIVETVCRNGKRWRAGDRQIRGPTSVVAWECDVRSRLYRRETE